MSDVETVQDEFDIRLSKITITIGDSVIPLVVKSLEKRGDGMWAIIVDTKETAKAEVQKLFASLPPFPFTMDSSGRVKPK